MDTMKIKVGPVEVEMLADDRICIGLRKGKSFEPATLVEWARMCRPGATVVDVGCYSGLFSIAAAMLGATPIGIEPLPFMREQIARNAALNGVDFRVVPAAASDASGKARIGYNDKVHLTSGASLLRTQGAGIVVDTVCLDEILAGQEIAAIKIDVERHEAAVIRGGRKIIEQHRPEIIAEVLEGEAVDALVKVLPGYRLERMLDGRNAWLVPA